MYYLIEETLKEVKKEALKSTKNQYVAVLSSGEWKQDRDSFEMGMDIDTDMSEIFTTKAEVNYDSLTGSFSIPNRKDLSADDSRFAFALDEKGIVFIDDSGKAEELIRNVQRTKKWKFPSLERFIYDFLDQIVTDDLRLMEKYERELDSMEKNIMDGEETFPTVRLNDIRSDIRDLRIHYEQLIDLGQELEENENNFFKHENLRYFRLFLNRMARLHDSSNSLRDYTMQIRDQYKAHLDIKQNRIMTILTVVTTIFMPLTLIVGWYGMNFRYMPELEWRWGYPVIIVISLLIAIGCLLFFKKKKWL
ncbi:MAG: magnesium transporter CorA [Lachnospiraceae bacterium]|nr:magnesium transporter CorA [Lachnospiraceae bacterium]